MKFGIMVRTGPYSNQNIDTALRLLNAALDEDHEAALFLYEDGVINAVNRMKPTGDRHIGEQVQALAERGADVAICGQCGNYRGMNKDDVIQGVKRAGLGQLAQMVNTCHRFFSLGF
jgi:tRNA 2-thiouridine synthesizing protein D